MEIVVATASNPPGQSPVSPVVKWLILILASIGFAFDIYEILMAPLIIRPAYLELQSTNLGLSAQTWIILLLFIPAIFGGAFGLVGGYLTDWLGRRRVLTWSILCYAISAFLAGYSTSLTMLLLLRVTTFVGVCVEFVAAVAWLAELFPIPEQREKVLGYTQGFSSLGGLLVAVAFGICSRYGEYFPRIYMPTIFSFLGTIEESFQHAAWRYTLMSGLIPAIPLILIRPFLPESPVWQQKKDAGTLKRPSIKELFTDPRLRTTTIVTTIMFACSYGAAFGAIQHIPRIVPGLEVVQDDVQKEIAAKKATTPDERIKIQQRVEGVYAAEYTKMQEVGGLVGRFLLVFVIIQVASRRAVIRIFQLPGLIILPLVFWYFLTMPNQTYFNIPLEALYLGTIPVSNVSIGVFLCGLFTVAQFSFWGNYLPTVYPVHLRGTGESFAANIGGRMIGTSFWAVTVSLTSLLPGESQPERLAYAAALVGLFVYAAGLAASFFLPEPRPEAMEE
jgi:MFS family permease